MELYCDNAAIHKYAKVVKWVKQLRVSIFILHN